MYSLQQIKNNVSELRKKTGLTQKEMAEKLSITQPAYSYYETGDKPLPINKLKAISEILNIALSEIIGSDDENINNIPQQSGIEYQLKRIADSLEIISQHLSGV